MDTTHETNLSSLKLALTDAVSLPLCFKYTFEKDELNVNLLRSSLEELLDGDFWPLRGVLRGMHIVVENLPRGGYFEVSDRADLHLSDVREDAALAHALTEVTEGDTVLRVRVTCLADGHLLGVNISHTFADAHTYFQLFWAAWAAKYSRRPFEHTVLTDRSPLMHAPTEVKAAFSPHITVVSTSSLPTPVPLPDRPEKTEGGSPNVYDLVHLSGNDLRALLAHSGCQTRVQAIFALVWKALRASQLVFPCNVRENERRWAPPIPFGYTGNAIFLHGCFCDNVEALTLSELGKLVKEAIDGCTAEANTALLKGLAEIIVPEGNQLITVPMGEKCVAIRSWAHSELCPTFGTARPRILWTSPDFPRHLLTITDGEPDGLDIHGHFKEVNIIRAALKELKL